MSLNEVCFRARYFLESDLSFFFVFLQLGRIESCVFLRRCLELNVDAALDSISRRKAFCGVICDAEDMVRGLMTKVFF